MKQFLIHIRSYIIRGLLAAIPLFLSLLTLQVIYTLVDKFVVRPLEHNFGIIIPGVLGAVLGVLLVVVVLSFIGIMASHVLGRRIFVLLEGIFNRIPILKTVYQVGKQVSSTFSLPEKQVFKRALLVELKEGVWIVGFVTGTLVDQKNPREELLKVFLPTVPNPTTGFITVVKASQVIDPHWTVEDALKVVISGGIIGPEDIRKKDG